MKLQRTPTNKPNFKTMAKTITDLEQILHQNPIDKSIWENTINSIIEFQDFDGSFKLINSLKIESDCRVEYCYYPTYLCTAILMKAYINDNLIYSELERVLRRALEFSLNRELKGQGYDALSGQIKAMDVFIAGGLYEFISKYPSLCPAFTKMVKTIVEDYCLCIRNKSFVFYFGENYKYDLYRITKAMNCRFPVFVYGTLLKGESNHDRYLEDVEYVGNGEIAGYSMYDLGGYPGIVSNKNGKVKGELYLVDSDTLARLDYLEGEGSLYLRKTIQVLIADKSQEALVYIYNNDVKNYAEILYSNQPYTNRKDLVWYIAYGSNLSSERFYLYIKGGAHPYSRRELRGCSDSSLPKKSVPVNIPYDMYFGWHSNSWGGSAIAYIDTSKSGYSIGRAYLISEKQYQEIRDKESRDSNYYDKEVRLADIDGIPAYTITNHRRHDSAAPSELYLNTIIKGIKETYPEMSVTDIERYLKKQI